MAIRIPGRQPSAGLESFFLNESPAWLPTQRESALVVLGAASGVSEGLANGGTAPLGGALSDTGTIDSEQAYLAGALEDQANRAVSDAGSVNNLRGDPLAGNFGAIDDSIGRTGSGLGSAPGVNIGLPPPGNFSPPNQGPGGGPDAGI